MLIKDLGIGIQLVNIVRDVGFDASTLNRIYLPQEDMAVTGATDDDFAKGIQPSQAARETIKRVSLKARLPRQLINSSQDFTNHQAQA